MATLSRLRQLKYVLDQTISFHNLIFCLIVFSVLSSSLFTIMLIVISITFMRFI